MTHELLGEAADELFEDAPCGLVSTAPDGVILVVNRTFERLTGLSRADVVGSARFQDLLTAPGRIYHETHYRPLLLLSGEAREIALELQHRDGSRVPVLLSSIVASDDDGSPRAIRTAVFPATDRRRYEEELLLSRRHDREIALRLQRSLLPSDLPEAPGLELEVVYRPGVGGLQSGGDWYDAFWLVPEESVALVVGDVVGQGIDAAAVMGQLRSALRAFASTGLPPHRLLEALDRYAGIHGTGEMTTVVYAELSLSTRTLRFSCAGHPPPLVGAPGTEPFFASGGRSIPLAVTSGEVERSDATIELEPGTTLLLYTDGLVEHPSRSLDVGMDLLRRTVIEGIEASPRALAETILRRLSSPDYTDDICFVVARVSSGGASVEGVDRVASAES